MECTVGLEVRPATELADDASLERTVSTALAEVGVRPWSELVARQEAALPTPAGCPACRDRMKANGGHRAIWSPSRVRLSSVPAVRCLGCGTPEHVPLDATLGLAPRVAHTLRVRERALWLVPT